MTALARCPECHKEPIVTEVSTDCWALKCHGYSVSSSSLHRTKALWNYSQSEMKEYKLKPKLYETKETHDRD